MKLIQTLSEEIEEELDGAENYVKMALSHKSEHPNLAKHYMTYLLMRCAM